MLTTRTADTAFSRSPSATPAARSCPVRRGSAGARFSTGSQPPRREQSVQLRDAPQKAPPGRAACIRAAYACARYVSMCFSRRLLASKCWRRTGHAPSRARLALVRVVRELDGDALAIAQRERVGRHGSPSALLRRSPCRSAVERHAPPAGAAPSQLAAPIQGERRRERNARRSARAPYSGGPACTRRAPANIASPAATMLLSSSAVLAPVRAAASRRSRARAVHRTCAAADESVRCAARAPPRCSRD